MVRARVVDAAGMKLMKPLHEPEAEEFRFRSPSHSSMPEPDAPLRIRPDRHLGDDYRAAGSHPGRHRRAGGGFHRDGLTSSQREVERRRCHPTPSAGRARPARLRAPRIPAAELARTGRPGRSGAEEPDLPGFRPRDRATAGSQRAHSPAVHADTGGNERGRVHRDARRPGSLRHRLRLRSAFRHQQRCDPLPEAARTGRAPGDDQRKRSNDQGAGIHHRRPRRRSNRGGVPHQPGALPDRTGHGSSAHGPRSAQARGLRGRHALRTARPATADRRNPLLL